MKMNVKRLLALVLVLVLTVSLTLPAAAEETADLVISKADDLLAFATDVNGGNTYEGKTVVLAAELDLSGAEWTPIGNGSRDGSTYTGNAFKGTFDGQGFTVTGLNITATNPDTAGLFGVVDGGTVKNVKFANVNINVTTKNAGSAVGLLVNGGTVSGVSVLSGSVTAADGAGGVVGRMTINATVSGCSNAANVTGAAAGGIVGKAYYTGTSGEMNITDCSNTGAITSNASGAAGGIVGFSTANVKNCTNSGVITANENVGGIVGWQQMYGEISGNTNTADISTNAVTTAGGIVGWIAYQYKTDGTAPEYPVYEVVTVTGNTNNGAITAANTAIGSGGIVGNVYNAAIITGNTNTAASISGSAFAAGILGAFQENQANGHYTAQNVIVSNNISTTVLANITANCVDEYGYNNKPGSDVYVEENNGAAAVAKIGSAYYPTLEAAITAANGKTVTLLKDVELTETLTVPASANATLDLNSHTISQTKQQTDAYSMVVNKGALTITDSGEGGAITYVDSGNGGEYVSNTILNEGTLTVSGGTISNKSSATVASNGYPHAIDARGTVTINGGVVACDEYSAVRIWCTTAATTVNIQKGATIDGTVDFHNVNNNANVGNLVITGGTFNRSKNAAVIRVLNFGKDLSNMTSTISDGTFNGDIIINNYSGDDATVSEVFTVTGGSFVSVPDCVAEGYAFDVKVGDYYIVHQHNSDADIDPVESSCTETGLTAGKKCSVCGKTMVAPTETPVKEHNWSTDYQPGTDTHWHYCTSNGCTAKKDEAAHTFVEKVDYAYAIDGNDCAVQFIQQCSVCGKGNEEKTFWVVKDNPTHAYDEGTVTKEATCAEAGVKTYTCTNKSCGHTKTEPIAAKAHTEVDLAAKEATCTETGLTAGKKCSVCGTVTVAQTEVAAKGHKLTKVEAADATYFAAGNIEYYTCDGCDKLFADAEGKKELAAADVIIPQLVKIEDTTADVSTEVVDNVIKEAETAGTVDIVITVTKDEMAEEEEKEEGTTPDSGTAEPAPAPVVTKTQLPAAAVEKIAALDEKATLTVNMTNATVVMDKTTLDVVAEAAKTEKTDSIALEIEHIETKELTATQQKAVEEKKVAAVISASILVNDKEVHDFEGGKVTVSIPFTPAEGTKGSDYVVLYVADDGTVEEIPTAYADGTLVMTLSHFSEYVVVDTSAKASTPATGDSFSPMVVFALLAVSAAAIVVLTAKKRRSN